MFIVAPLHYFGKRKGNMGREIREEDAMRNSLVCFTDARDEGSKIMHSFGSGFGIDMGPGLPPGSRLIFVRASHQSYQPVLFYQQNIILLDASHPLITIRPIVYADLFVHAGHLKNLAAVYVPAVLNEKWATDTDHWHGWNIFRLVDWMTNMIEILTPFVPIKQLHKSTEELLREASAESVQ